MQKSKPYRSTKFSTDVIKESLAKFKNLAGDQEIELDEMSVTIDDETWKHENIEEFMCDYRKSNRATLSQSSKDYKYYFRLSFSGGLTTVSIEAPIRASIQSIFEIFEENQEVSKIKEIKENNSPPLTVFIGHGRDTQWKELKDHLQDKHKHRIESYETGSRAGHTIRDILESMAKNSSFAVLVLSAEDKQEDGTYNPRLNVVHETGLFQGRLGFDRAIVLLEDGANEFTNLNGIQQIRFSKGRIKETFGDVLGVIKREFDPLQ